MVKQRADENLLFGMDEHTAMLKAIGAVERAMPRLPERKVKREPSVDRVKAMRAA